MSIAPRPEPPFFERPDVKAQIKRLASSRRLTLVAGAGIGAEMGYPDWPLLVTRLLTYAVAGANAKRTQAGPEHQRVIELVLEHEGLMGAATIARAKLGRRFNEALRQALYGTDWPDVHLQGRFSLLLEDAPPATVGSTAEAIGALYAAACATGHECQVATTNYDLILEDALSRALAAPVTPWLHDEDPSEEHGHAHLVRHLHGVLPPKGRAQEVVLTEAEYHAAGAHGTLAWQETYLRRRLRESVVVFVGTSLTDLHLLAFLFRYARQTPAPVAVLVRKQPAGRTPDLFQPPDEAVVERDALVKRRWEELGLATLAADYESQPGQFLCEVAHHKQDPAAEQYGLRLDRWFETATSGFPLDLRDRQSFCRTQDRAQSHAGGWLREVIGLVRESGNTLDEDERMAIHLWCRSPERLSVAGPPGQKLSSLAMIACSDRAWRTPEAIDTRRIMLPTRRAAIEAFCHGRIVLHETEGGHQWNYVIGIPILLRRSSHERLPVGAITIESTAPGSKSVLARMALQDRRGLQDLVDYLQGVGDAFLSTIDE
jgi:hypothetical protein